MMLMGDPQPSGAFQWTQEPWGRALRCARLPAVHLFTSRDLSLRSDQAEWEAVARSLDVTPDRLLLLRQVHGTHVTVARRGRRAGSDRPEADIILTDDPDVAIGVLVADCAPILLLDPEVGVAGAVHAGWRGTAAGAAHAAVRAMREHFGCAPERVIAAIGPCLGACCGEVGPEVVEAFRRGGADRERLKTWFARGAGDRWLLDLARANVDQLRAAGVPAASIFDAGLCTKTHHLRLHSYRADGQDAGRSLAAIRVSPRPV
jgi:purine-nucleoside/S-methyl-5'-thioadenosine phosphorylase / adenosine deaminase